jgi:hypothetical protein
MTPMRQLSSDEEIQLAREKYSKWHRYPTLPYGCYMVDMDWVEMRCRGDQSVPIAFIECVTYRADDVDNAEREKPLTKAKDALCSWFAKILPTYIVWVNPHKLGNSANFLVKRVSEETSKVLTEEDYKKFLESL